MWPCNSIVKFYQNKYDPVIDNELVQGQIFPFTENKWLEGIPILNLKIVIPKCKLMGFEICPIQWLIRKLIKDGVDWALFKTSEHFFRKAN